MQLFTVFILSLFLTIALVPVFRRLAFRMNIMDIPDARKVHVVPMPKTGGISMAIGVFVPVLLWVPRDDFLNSVLIGSIIIVVFGLMDDIRPMTAKQKILPQIAAALIVILFGGVEIISLGDFVPEGNLLPWFVSIPLTLFVIVGVTNAINLSDGLDGLAGGISMLSFSMIAFLAYRCGNVQVCVMAVAMVGGIAGFLRYNTYPATLFMGDAGSQLLGFLSIVFVIVLTQTNTPYSKVLGLPLIGFPILDTLTVMGERIIQKRSPFRADKNHFHHRLLRFGFFPTEAVLMIYIIQSCFIGMAFMLRFHSDWVHVAIFLLLSSMILLSFFIAGKNNWEFKRDGWFDKIFKKRLKVLKERKIFVRLSFAGLRYGFFLVLMIQILIPRQIPLFFSIIAGCLIILIWAGYYFKLIRFKATILRTSIYGIIPLLLYLTESDPASWMSGFWFEINNTAFIALVLFIVLTMNLTNRRKGLKLTPMDILMFIVILVFPNLPSMHLQQIHVSVTLAKSLVLFFGFDVLIGEVRGEIKILTKSSIYILTVLAIRGIIA